MKNTLILLCIIYSNIYADAQVNLQDCKSTSFFTAWEEPRVKETAQFVSTCQTELKTTLSRINLLDAIVKFNKKDFVGAVKTIEKSRSVLVHAFEMKNQSTDKLEVNKYFYLQMLTFNAYANYQLENYEEAKNDFELYIKIEKDLAYMQFLGSCYSQLKEFSQAISILKEVYALEPTDDTVLYLASVYAKSKDFKNSMIWLNRISKTSNQKVLQWIKADDNFKNIENYKEFQVYVRKLRV